MTEENQKLKRLKNLSVLMDSKFKGPFGYTFGLDGLLGLIPFVGDFATNLVSLYIILQAGLMGCSPAVLFRMGMNLLVENLFDLFPFLGNFFDFFWKANNKNVSLLEKHIQDHTKATFEARLVLGALAFSLIGMMIGSIAITTLVIQKIISTFF